MNAKKAKKLRKAIKEREPGLRGQTQYIRKYGSSNIILNPNSRRAIYQEIKGLMKENGT